MSHYHTFKKVLDALRTLPPSAAKEKAIQKLEESAFWASSAIVGEESPIDYVTKGDNLSEPTNVLPFKRPS